MSFTHPMSIPQTYCSADHGLLIPIAGIELDVDAHYSVWLHADSRGESEDCEGYSLTAFTGAGRIAWVEGIRRDRSCMREPYKSAIDAILAPQLTGAKS